MARLSTVFKIGAALVAAGAASQAAAAAGDANADMVARGKYLTTAGDCAACHTAPGGKPFAGGLAINSPFGVMRTPNITPDQETGIGSWSSDEFYASMHDGIGKGGEHLYPAMPYPWYTRVTRDDVDAIRAYMLTIPAVHAPNQKNDLMFPFTVRAGIAAWNVAYFHSGTFEPDASKSAEINRGAYLVEGLGHCSDCHTPKNAAQAPENSHPYAGGVIDGWYAPNISGDVREGVGGWSDTELVTYLKTGASPGRGVVLGPMAETVHQSLSMMTDEDLRAMAAYLKSTPAQQTFAQAQPKNSAVQKAGQDVYVTNCASCHQLDGRGIPGAVPPLADNGAVVSKGPQNVIRAVLGGLPALGTYAPMPGFGAVMSAAQIADVTNWVRTAWSNGAPETATAAMVSQLAGDTKSMMAGNQDSCSPLGTSQVDAAISDPGNGIAGIMKDVNANNILPSVDQIISKVRGTAPQGAKADIVNSLTAAYCPIVASDAATNAAQKRWRLSQFASLVYTQLSSNGKN